LSRYAIDSFQYPSPETDLPGFLDTMEAAVRKFRPAGDAPYVLMPMHRESYPIADHRSRFEGMIRVPLASSDKLALARHKRHLLEHARDRGIPIPPTWFVRDRGELAQVAAQMRFPVYVKLPDAAAGVGVRKVHDVDGLLATFQELVDSYGLRGDGLPLVQAAVEGEDYCVTALFDRGQVGAALVYRNVLQFPRDHGPGVVRETVAAPVLEQLTEKLLASLGWHGIAQVDWRWDGKPHSEPLLLEVNPRFFGGLAQAIASGIDYPWLLYRLAIDGEIPTPEPVQIGTRTEAPVVSLLASVQEIAESDLHLQQLEQSWQQAKDALTVGHGWTALSTMLGGLKDALDVEGRLHTAKALLEDNAENVSVLIDADDPLPVLGLVYPLDIFLRHGKINQELLSGTQSPRGG
jgi:hypothetical protein